MGEGHLVKHVPGAISRRCEGFGLLKLGVVLAVYGSALEPGGHDAHHAVLMSAMEELWLASVRRRGYAGPPPSHGTCDH